MRKSLKEISWQVDEATYRANPAISYSALSTYAREGHTKIPTLWDSKDSAALRFGGLVDALLTEPETVKERFFIADFPTLTDAVLKIVKQAFNSYSQECRSLDKIPEDALLKIIENNNYAANWLPKTRVNDIIKKGKEYYDLLSLSGGKTIISSDDNIRAHNCVDTLKTHPFTKELLFDNPFDSEEEGFYQLKFLLEEHEDEEIPRPVRCMFDRIIVNHKNKTIMPCDLKTTGKNEYDFKHSFLEWRYDLQATLYSYILWKTILKDDYYKSFTILPFTFIVINRYNLTPLIWQFKHNLRIGDWQNKYGTEYKGWQTLLYELDWHLTNQKFEYPVDAYLNEGVLTIDNLVAYEGNN